MGIEAPARLSPASVRKNYLELAVASLILADGIASTVLGHRFITLLQRLAPRPFTAALGLFLRLPEPLFCAGAVVQAGVGAYLMLTTVAKVHGARAPGKQLSLTRTRWLDPSALGPRHKSLGAAKPDDELLAVRSASDRPAARVRAK
jgi:hypothetical protein